MGTTATDVGTGTTLFTAGEVSGTARWFLDTADVLAIDDDDLEDTIAFVHKGGMTFLSPILPDLRGIVCTAGSRESHLADGDADVVLAGRALLRDPYWARRVLRETGAPAAWPPQYAWALGPEG